MADIAGPNILSVVRKNGYQIEITFELGASGMNKIYADVRTMTSGWAQGNAEDLPGSNVIVVSARAGVQLDAKVAYQVKLRARHSSNLPVAESGTANVGAWEVATPTLLSATRPNPTTIALTYADAVTAGGAALYVDRRATPSGTWQRYTTFTPNASGTGTYSILATPASQSFEVRILSGQYGVYSGESSPRSVNAFEVPIPMVASVARSGQTFATIAYTGAVVGAQLVVEFRRAGSLGAFTARTSNPAATAGNYTLTGLDGTLAYEVQAYTIQGDAASGRSSSKSLEAWFSLPAAVSDLSAARRVDGTVDLTWTGSPTTRAPYAGQRVLRAEGELGQLTLLPAGSIVYTRRTFWDGTAKPEREYRYTVVPFNDAGEATARPTVRSGATVLVPNAPSSTTAVWVSDTTADVSWPNPATADRPVARFIVRRWLLGAWSTVNGNVPAGTLTWRDGGLSKNGVYKYQVQAVNAAGPSATYSPESAEVVTTPTGASSVTAARVGPDIRISWVAPASTIATSWTIEQTTDVVVTGGSTWYPVSVGTLPGSARVMVHGSPVGGVPHTYRIRPTRTAAPVAPWVQSNKVSEYSTPNAPTLIPPVVFDASQSIRLGWVHNPTDGTAQADASVRFRKSGGEWTTLGMGAAAFYDIPAGTFVNGDVVEWQVTTEGAGGVSGPWGASSFTTRARPTVSVTAPIPGQIVASATVTVSWATSSQSSYTVRLLDGNGNVVEVRSAASSSLREVAFSGLSDRGEYTAQVTVRDAYQDSLPNSVAFTVELDRPAPPTLTADPNPDDGTVLLTATAVQGLRMTRENVFSGRAVGWGSSVTDVVLADGSLVWQSSGASFGSAAVGENRYLSMDVSRADVGGASIVDGSTLNVSLSPTPILPAFARLSATAVQGATPWQLTGTGVYFSRVLDMRWPSGGTAPASFAYFDGDTLGGDFIYRWNFDGTSYEAVPTSDPLLADRPVAQTVRIEIIRINPDGRAFTLGDVGEDGTLTDPLPPLGVAVTYIARAWTDAPAYTDSKPTTVRLDGTGVILNHGPGWTGLAIVKANLSFNVETSSTVELVHFDRDDSGKPNLPVAYSSGTATHTAAVSGATDYELGSTEAEWDLVTRQLLVWYRDPEGRTFPASVPAVRFGQEREGGRTLTFTASEVDAAGWEVEASPPPRFDASTFDFAGYFSEGIAD